MKDSFPLREKALLLKLKLGDSPVRGWEQNLLCVCVQQAADTLKHKVRNRSDRGNVVKMHILQGKAALSHNPMPFGENGTWAAFLSSLSLPSCQALFKGVPALPKWWVWAVIWPFKARQMLRWGRRIGQAGIRRGVQPALCHVLTFSEHVGNVQPITASSEMYLPVHQ